MAVHGSMTTIQFKRGALNTLPDGNLGEPLFTTDSNDFFIGTGLTTKPKRITISQDTKESDDIIKIGQPLYINNSGHVQLAKAVSSYQNTVGLSLTNTNPSFACTYQTSGVFTLSDWTNVTGTALLVPNSFYFLDSNNFGKLTNISTSIPGQYSIRIGYALDTINLDISNKLQIKL